jgi:hypothetical protein
VSFACSLLRSSGKQDQPDAVTPKSEKTHLNANWTALPDCAPVTSALFQPGRILATPTALRAMQAAGAGPCDYLRRHLTGSWGIVSVASEHDNDCAIRKGGRIFSLHRLKSGTKIWIITEADRSATSILLSAEWRSEK